MKLWRVATHNHLFGSSDRPAIASCRMLGDDSQMLQKQNHAKNFLGVSVPREPKPLRTIIKAPDFRCLWVFASDKDGRSGF